MELYPPWYPYHLEAVLKDEALAPFGGGRPPQLAAMLVVVGVS